MSVLLVAWRFLLRIPWQLWLVLLVFGLLWASYLRGVHIERGRWEARVAAAAEDVRRREEQDRQDVEKQNRADRERIADLEARLAAALAPRPDPAPRIVRVCDDRAAGVPGPEAHAGGAEAGPAGGQAVRDADAAGGALLAFRADLLRFAAACQADNIGALAGQEQWPK